MDKNIDESIRKPRRSKGTPFFNQRNYYALGLVGLSIMTGILFEFWGQSKKLKQSILDGKFDYPDALKERIARQRLIRDPEMQGVLRALDERREQQEEESKPQSPLVKFFRKVPDL